MVGSLKPELRSGEGFTEDPSPNPGGVPMNASAFKLAATGASSEAPPAIRPVTAAGERAQPRTPPPVTKVSVVTLRGSCLSPQTFLTMQFSRTHIGIAVGTGALLVLVFLGYLYWLSTQPPVLARSEERDPLTNMPLSITMNPFRDRTMERTANAFIAQMRDGNCRKVLAAWEKKKDYRRKRADFLCNSEAQHPLISWKLVDWEDQPPLIILHYKGERYTSPAQDATYRDLFSVTLENKDGTWEVTKYDAFY